MKNMRTWLLEPLWNLKFGVWSFSAAAILFAETAVSATAAPTPTNAAAAPDGASALADLFPDIVVAKGKGFEIKRSKLDGALMRFKADAVARGQTIAPEAMAGL